jgi:hypothetical protein
MISTPSFITGLGFERWAQNVVVNLLEDGVLEDGLEIENDGVSITVRDGLVTIRAYTQQGWKFYQCGIGFR